MTFMQTLKESWRLMSKQEAFAWFIFTGMFSFLMAYGTSIWSMDRDKVEMSYLIYKFVMTILLIAIGFGLLQYGTKASLQGKNDLEVESLIRTFSAQSLFGSILFISLLVEVFIPSMRSVQLLEYMQGMCYFGILTGVGMGWYFVAVDYVPKKRRNVLEGAE